VLLSSCSHHPAQVLYASDSEACKYALQVVSMRTSCNVKRPPVTAATPFAALATAGHSNTLHAWDSRRTQPLRCSSLIKGPWDATRKLSITVSAMGDQDRHHREEGPFGSPGMCYSCWFWALQLTAQHSTRVWQATTRHGALAHCFACSLSICFVGNAKLRTPWRPGHRCTRHSRCAAECSTDICCAVRAPGSCSSTPHRAAC
jgi:hypothetical protein